MRALTPDQIRASLTNATASERDAVHTPIDLMVLDWEHLDFLAFRDADARNRGYIVIERAGEPVGIAVRAANSAAGARAGMCDLCHAMQPGNQVALYNARRAGRRGEDGDSIGIYICTDLSCHDNVRIAAPLAPSEVRSSVDLKIDRTRQRVESFVGRVVGDA